MMTKVLQGVMFSAHAAQDARYEKLAAKLTAHQGDWLVPREEDNLDALLASGTFYDTAKKGRSMGLPNECHVNSAYFVDKRAAEGWEVHTGYALSDDGKWRQHSWVWHPKNNYLVETTVDRVAYFGIRDPSYKSYGLPGLPR